jgi:hypothetical protein
MGAVLNILELILVSKLLVNEFRGDNSLNKNISEDNLKFFLKKFDSLSVTNNNQMSKKVFRNYWTREDEFSVEQIDAVVCVIFLN